MVYFPRRIGLTGAQFTIPSTNLSEEEPYPDDE